MLGTRRVLLLALPLLCAAGCGDKKHPAAMVGTWKMTEVSGAKIPPAAQPAVKMILSQANVRMVLSADGKIEQSTSEVNIMGRKLPGSKQSGTWEVDGDKLKSSIGNLTGPGVPGSSSGPADGVQYKLSEDSKSLRLLPEGLEIVYVKQ